MKTITALLCTVALLVAHQLALAGAGNSTQIDLREKIRVEGIKKAEELGYKPAIVERSEAGTIVYRKGSELKRVNGKLTLIEGNLVVNAGEKAEEILGAKLEQGEFGVIKDGKLMKLPGTLGGAKVAKSAESGASVVVSGSGITVEEAYAIIDKGQAKKYVGKPVKWEIGPGDKQKFVQLAKVGDNFELVTTFLVQTKSGRYFAVEVTQSQADDFNTVMTSGFAVGVFDGSRELEKRTVPCVKFVKSEVAVDSAASKGVPKDVRQAAFEKLPPDWPKASGELEGRMEVRVRNPNDFKVRVGLRSEAMGKDFVVAANDVESVRVPNGRYDIYFHYSSDPDGLYQGDTFTLQDNGVEIQIVKVVNGNYGIRKLK